MALRSFFCTCFFFVSLSYCSTHLAAYQADQQPSPQLTVEQEKALKYHAALQRRPAPGYLYDRFYNSWLDSSSIADLEKFLTDKATESSATNDRLLLAFFYAKQGEDVRALEQFRVALENDPSSAETWYEKAVVEARTLDFETALADLAKAQQAEPKKDMAVKIAKLRGKLFVRNQQTEEAIAVWDELVTKNPTDEGLMEDMIELQISEGLYEQAEKLCDKLIAITKDPYQLVMRKLRKGDIVQRSGDRTKAIAIYGETLDKVGMDTWLEREILSQIEQPFRREDDLTGLRAHYEKLISETPKRMALRKSFGKLQLELGESEEAIKTFQAIVELTPGDRVNRESLIGILAGADKLDLAIKQTQSLIEQFPKDAELDVRLAQLCSENSQKSEAAAAIESFLKKSGGNEYAYLRAANMFNRFDQAEQAEATYKKCVESFPESDTARESYAAYLYDHEKKPEALAIWNELATDGDREKIVRVARILTSRKEHQAAFDLLNARYDEFKLDSIFLGQLCTEAIALKKYEEAIPWSKQRVKLAKNYGDLETSVAQAIQIIDRSEATDATIKELKGVTNLGVPSTCLLAGLLESTFDSPSADKLLSDSITAISSDAENRSTELQMLASQQVRILKGRRDWKAAANAVKAMIEMPGGRKSVNIRQLVELYQRDSDMESALTWIGEWKKISPGNLLPWFNESKILARMGRNEESVNVLRVAAQKFPESPDLFAQLAESYVNNGQYKDAERIYWRQYEESDKLSDKLRWTEQLANLNVNLGETSDFFKKLEERQRNNPKSIEPLLALAQAHRIADNYEERRKWLLEATRVQPDNLPLLQEIARLEESEGDWEKAIATLRTAEKLDSTNRTRQQIARIYLKFDEPQKGFAILLEIAGGNNADAREIETITDAIFGASEYEEAVRFILPQTQRFPKDYRLQYQLGVIQEELGNVDDAIQAFLSVLESKDDIGGLKKPTTDPFMQIDMYRSMMPEELMDIMELVYAEDAAYTHQNNNGRGYSPFGGSYNPAVKIQLPLLAKDARNFAIVHLVRIADELEEDAVTTLTTQMKNAGVLDVDLLIGFGGQISQIFQGSDDLLEEFPDNRALLACCVMNWMNQPGELEHVEKAYAAFKDSHAELSFLAALSMAQRDKKYSELLDESLAKIKEVQQPNFMTLSAIAQLTNQQMAASDPVFEDTDGDGDGISKAQITELNNLLVDWYPKLQGGQYSGMSSWVFSSIYASLENGESAEALIKFLDEEVARSKKKKVNAANPMLGYYGMSSGIDESMVGMINFPPQTLINFPQTVLGTLSLSQDNYGGGFGGFGESIGSDEWRNKFGSSVDQATDPILRALLQLKVVMNDDELDKPIDQRFTAAKATIAEVLESDRPDIDAYLLAIGIATQEERWADASGLLEKTRNLPLSRGMRQKVDGALVAIATQGIDDLKSDENKNIIASAKAAALRLRRGRLQPNQRVQLVEVFETLGLTKEAEKMEEKLAQAPVTPSSSYGGGLSVAAPAPDRIRKLIDEGKTEAAVRLLSQQFKSLARNQLNPNSMSSGNWEIEEFKRNLSAYQITDELLKELDPGESTSNSKRIDYGFAQETFGDKAKAIELYQQCLEANTKQDGVRMRLMLLEVQSDPDALVNHFDKFQKRNRSSMGYQLNNIFNNEHDLDFDQQLKIFDSVAGYLDTLEETESLNLSWVTSLLSQLTGNLRISSNEYLYGIYLRKKADDNDEEDFSSYEKKLQKQRKELGGKRFAMHERFCNSMLRIPQLAPEGFSSLAAAAEADGQEIGPRFLELAKNSLIKFKTPKQSVAYPAYPAVQYHGGFAQYSYSSGEELVQPRTPQEFLIQHFGMNDDADRIAQFESILEEIKTSNKEQKELTEKMRAKFQLYVTEPDQFLVQSAQYVEAAAESGNRQTKSTLKQGALTEVIEVWNRREIESSLTDMIIEHKKESSKFQRGMGHYYGGSSLETLYLTTLGERKDTEEIKRFLKELAIQTLGPEDQQVEFVAKHIKAKSGRQSKERTKIYQHAELMSGIISIPELVGPAWNEIRRLGLLEDDQTNLRYQISNVTDYVRDGEQLLAIFETVGLMGELKDFDPYLFGRESEQTTVWGSAISQLQWRKEELKNEAIELLEDKEELQFGEEVILLILQEKFSKFEFNILLGEHLEQLESISDERILALAKFRDGVRNKSSSSKDKLTKNGKIADKMIKKVVGTLANKDLQKLIAAKRMSDLDVETYNMDEWAARVLGDIDPSETEQISTAFVKVSNWMQKINQSNSYNGISTNFASNLLKSIVSRNSSFETMGLAIALLNNEDKVDVRITESLNRNFARFLQTEFQNLGKKKRNKSKDKNLAYVKTLNSLYQEIGSNLPEQNTLELLTVYYRFLESTTPEKLDKAIEWAEMESDGGKHPELARTWKLALALRKSHSENFDSKNSDPFSDTPPEKVSRNATANDWQAEWMQMINDESIPLGRRVDLAETLVIGDATLPVENVWQCTSVISVGSESNLVGNGEVFSKLFDIARNMDDPNLKENGKPLSKAWQKSIPNSNSYMQGREIVSALEFFHATDDQASVKKLMRYQEGNAGDPTVLGALIRLGYPKLALGAWRRNSITGSPPESLENYDFEYTKSFHETMPKFLELLPNEGAKLFAESWFSCMKDPKDESEKYEVDRKARMVILAERFSNTEFASASDRQSCLIVLQDARNAKEHIQQPLAEAAEKIRSIDLWQRNTYDDRFSGNQQILTAHVRMALRNGDAKPFIKTQAMLSDNAPSDNDYQYNQMVQQFESGISDGLSQYIAQSDEQGISDLLPELRKMAIPKENDYGSGTVNTLNLFAHIISGNMEAYNNWIDEFKTSSPAWEDSQAGDIDDMWDMAAEYVKAGPEMTDEKRFELAKTIWQFGKDAEFDIGSDHFKEGVQGSCKGCSKNSYGLEGAVEAGLLTNELLVSRGSELAEINPVDGESWSQIGRQQLKMKQLEAAAVSFEKALNGTTDKMEKALSNRKVELADVLSQLGKSDEAKAKLEDVDVDQLYGDFETKYNDLIIELDTDE